LEDDKIVVRAAMLPTEFACPACGLAFSGYARLAAAELGGQYTHTVRFDPLEYYADYGGEEYDNE
jgi:hypothetical protein